MMRSEQRIVVRLPLIELWDAAGSLSVTRGRSVGRTQISELLRRGAVRFVLADVGRPPQWVSVEDCFRFWKEEVKPRLVEPTAAERIRLEEYPGEYCFVATEWGAETLPLVVLEIYH